MNTLLVVEDEKLIRQGIVAMIRRSSVPVEEILECRNGEEALEILRKQRVDVMFTDIRMPKMDGLTLVNKMEELSQKPVVIVLSGYDEFSYAVEMDETWSSGLYFKTDQAGDDRTASGKSGTRAFGDPGNGRRGRTVLFKSAPLSDDECRNGRRKRMDGYGKQDPAIHRKRQLPDPADQQGKWGTVFEMQRNSAGRRRRRSSVSSAGTGGRADHERKR